MLSVIKLLTAVFAALAAMLRRPLPLPPPPPSPLISEGDRAIIGRGVPEHWPPRHNVNMEPCDMTDGPCCCGGWHDHGEGWVRDGVAWFGACPATG